MVQLYNEASIAFVDKVLEISGLGNRTYLPDSAPMSPFYVLMHLSLSKLRGTRKEVVSNLCLLLVLLLDFDAWYHEYEQLPSYDEWARGFQALNRACGNLST